MIRLMLMVQVSPTGGVLDGREIRIGLSVAAACTCINADSALKSNTALDYRGPLSRLMKNRE